MSGAVTLLDKGTKAVSTNTEIAGGGGHAAATFLANITAITGTWTLRLQYQIDGVFVNIASIAGRTTTGLVRFVLTAGEFDLTRQAIPEPVRIVYNEDVAGSITAEITAIYGD